MREGDCSLKINHDSTFVFTETFCGKGRVSRAGTWQLSGDDIIELNFEGKNLAKEFEVYDNRLWMETQGNTTKTKSPVVILCVLEKQD
ncbi:MAG: copper resistance protein NlpE N-terminal domain-containing protein [Flavobacterium sp.]